MTTPKIDVDAQVETKPEVLPDDGLIKIYQRFEKAQNDLRKAGEAHDSILVEVVEYVKKQKLSREVVRATLEKRELSEASINSELSRIFKYASPRNEEVFSKLKNREISQADARKLIVSKPQAFPARQKRDIHDRVSQHLYAAAKAAIHDLTSEEGEKRFQGVKDFTDAAVEAWRKAWAEQEAKVSEGAKSPQQAEAA